MDRIFAHQMDRLDKLKRHYTCCAFNLNLNLPKKEMDAAVPKYIRVLNMQHLLLLEIVKNIKVEPYILEEPTSKPFSKYKMPEEYKNIL